MASESAPNALLPGERVTGEKRVNAILDPRAFGLEPFSSAMGPDSEGIGGALELTQWRLVFTSHRLNRIVGSFGLALSDVAGAEDVSRGPRRVVRITTGDGAEHRFLMWGIKSFLDALQAARTAFDAEDEGPRLAQALAADPGHGASTLRVSEGVTTFVKRTRFGRS